MGGIFHSTDLCKYPACSFRNSMLVLVFIYLRFVQQLDPLTSALTSYFQEQLKISGPPRGLLAHPDPQSLKVLTNHLSYPVSSSFSPSSWERVFSVTLIH